MFMNCPCCCCPYNYYCSMQQMPSYSRPKKKVQRNVEHFYRQKEFTVEELAQFDGSGGKPAYVAVNGIVYDVSQVGAWGGGTHFGLYAGKDLTSQFGGCHPVSTILDQLPKVGVLK